MTLSGAKDLRCQATLRGCVKSADELTQVADTARNYRTGDIGETEVLSL